MCGSMADIQTATVEIRRGKKEQTTRQKYNGLPYSIRQPSLIPRDPEKICLDGRKSFTAPVNRCHSIAAAVHEQRLEGNTAYSAVS